AGDRAAVLADPSPLRYRVPALGDGARRLRLRLLRPPALVLADRGAHPAPAGDRRHGLRADPLRGEALGESRPDDAARARDVAPAADDARADARSARGLDPRAQRGAAPRRAAACGLAARRDHGLARKAVPGTA